MSFDELSLEERLVWVCQNHDNVAFSTSLGQEDQAITYVISKLNLPIRIFTLDTGRLFQESYELIDKTKTRYKKEIEVYFPDTLEVEKLTKLKGLNSFYESVENRKECCEIRKINPLERALQNVNVWITGIRSQQSENRSGMNFWEKDSKRNLFKFNPLLDWDDQSLNTFIEENKIPINPLHKKGFVSIGCAPCTRAIEEGEHPRAGRWWWELSKKECGLHQ